MLKVLFIAILLSAQATTKLNLEYDAKKNPPGEADIKLLMNRANQRLGSLQKPVGLDGCEIDYAIDREVNLEQDYVCFLPPKKTFTEWVFDPNDAVSYELVKANDGNLFNVRNEKNPNKKLSNDTGYTLGVNAKASRENTERLLSFEMDSKLYTARTKGPDGQYKTSAGKYYIDTYEISRINVNFEDKSRSDNLRAVGRVGLRMDSTNSDGVGAKLQDKWHDSLDRYKGLRYEQLAGGSSDMTLEAEVGLKKILEADLGQIHCAAAGTVMMGMDSKGNPLLTTKLEAQVSTGTMGGRSPSTPLFLIKALQEAHINGRERSTDQRLELGSYVYAGKNISVYAGLGRGRHVTNAASQILKDREMINYIILKANKKF